MNGSGIYAPTAANGATTLALNTYYSDPDGVVRLGDGAYADNTGDALAEMMLNQSLDGTTGVNYGVLRNTTSTALVSNFDSRPVILNRPFQSVAELGYVHRGMPWKSLDFFTPQSADDALLDVFCAYGPDP